MKNPLHLFTKLIGAPSPRILLTETATLEFCYDHVTEDAPLTQSPLLQLAPDKNFQLKEFEETE